MNLHEYQAKALFKSYGMPVPESIIATTGAEAKAAAEGGMEIETVAHDTPEKILKASIDPLVGLMPYQCRDFSC